MRLRSNLEALGRAAGERAETLRHFDVQSATPSTVAHLMNQLSISEVRQVENYIDRVHHLEERIQKPLLELMAEYDQYDVDVVRIYGASDSERVAELRRCGQSLISRIDNVGALAFRAAMAIRLVGEERRYPDLKARNLGGRP